MNMIATMQQGSRCYLFAIACIGGKVVSKASIGGKVEPVPEQIGKTLLRNRQCFKINAEKYKTTLAAKLLASLHIVNI